MELSFAKDRSSAYTCSEDFSLDHIFSPGCYDKGAKQLSCFSSSATIFVAKARIQFEGFTDLNQMVIFSFFFPGGGSTSLTA